MTPGSEDRAALRDAQGRLFFAWLFTLPILAIMAAHRLFGRPWPGPVLENLGMLILAAPVVFAVGRPILSSAARSLRSRRMGLDLLVAGAALAAYASGALALLLPVPGLAGLASVLVAAHLTLRYFRG